MNATNGQEPWTLLRLINATRDYFTSHQVDSPRLVAEVLLAHVLGCERMALYTRFGEVPSQQQRTALRELVRRAVEHEPVAYLVGHRDFYSLQLAVTPEVLIPRSETELVVDKAVEYLRGLGRPGACWDICTGSGAVAIAVAANVPDVTVLATDISEVALDVARRNAATHEVTDRVDVAAADLLVWPAGRDGPKIFDVITANPPYVTDSDMADLPPEVRREPRQALAGGADGLDFIRRILTDAPDILADGGLLAMEIGYNQAATVWDLLLQIDRYEQAQFFRDSARIERVLVAYKKQ